MSSPVPTEVELADAVTRAAKRIRRGTFHQLAPFGINPSQGRALEVLARGAQRGGQMIRLNQLAERLRIAPRSVTTVVDALEAAGLVARVQDPEDRRAILLRLTEAGEQTVDRIGQVRQQVAEEYFGSVGPEDRSALLRLLRSVNEAHDRAHPHHQHPHPHGHGHDHRQHGPADGPGTPAAD
ncbi:MarR family winged helix-turn-helix transcriptional regulator [Streptacidiphilus cavernicola]|uniref:MarR family winged helix-turn-helix transcriptional regulator n=1 Tax=Streptacidiphilus cavernicola TaxID=3342716 RepID=A0ABV6W061_9ACTN